MTLHIVVTNRPTHEAVSALPGLVTAADTGTLEYRLVRTLDDLRGLTIPADTEIHTLEPLPADMYAILGAAYCRRALAAPTTERLAAAFAAGQAAAANLAAQKIIDGPPAEVAAALDVLPDETIIRNQYDGTVYESNTDPIRQRRYWTPVGDTTADTSTYLADSIPDGFGFAVLHRPAPRPEVVDSDRQAGYL